MEKEDIERLLAAIEERAKEQAEAEYEAVADDGFEVARALLQALGRRLGVGFVLEVQREVLDRAEEQSRSDDPRWRADAVEIAAIGNAGYFHDLIEELAEKLPAGRA